MMAGRKSFATCSLEKVQRNIRHWDRITANSVVANGQDYPVDCLVYATGFEVGTGYTRRSGFELFGRGGRALSEHWAKGIRTFHGFHVNGFPNCFVVSNMQSVFSANFPHMLDEQAMHVDYVVKQCVEGQVRVIEAEAEDAWIETIRSLAILRRSFLEECTPGYYNNEGKPQERSEQDGFYGAGPIAFVKLLEEWRANGDMKGLVRH